MKSFQLDRRAMLRGAGVTIALPLLEAMMPVGKTAFAQNARPPRFIGYYTSCGYDMPNFTMPIGPIVELSRTLTPFANLKDKITQVVGLSGSREGSGGDHARGTQSFLRAAATGPSVDQIAHKAHMAGPDRTRFGSLAVGVNGSCVGTDGPAPPSSLCAISWESTNVYKPKDSDPQLLFNKLFMDSTQRKNQSAMDESVLSAVKDDAKKMQYKLGATDKQIVEQYFENIQEIENRIRQFPAGPAGSCTPGSAPIYETYSANKPQRARALADLTILAIQCDLARYMSFMLENGGDAVTYTHLGQSSSHYRYLIDGNRVQLQKIEQWMMGELAYLVQGLKDAKDITGGSLLDSCVIAMSSEFSDTATYSHTKMPFLLAGSCNGYFKMGQTIGSNGNFGDVWLSVLDALGYPQDRIGNSTGMLAELKA
jgi:Protein of unknown function (DUF1552)